MRMRQMLENTVLRTLWLRSPKKLWVSASLWVPLGVESERKTWVQGFYLGGEPRKPG